MNRWSRALIAILAVGSMSVACSAIVITENRGNWPDSWPKELEPLRDRGKTVLVGHGISETVYEIPFDSHEEFENAWLHILTLKSKGAPLILEKSPSTYSISGSTMPTGVRILWPSGAIIERPDGTRLEAKAPWPESIKSATGELPEYVRNDGGKWIPGRPGEYRGLLNRARVDIMLVTDGQIIDLNRIELPSETPIIDNRFKK